MAGNMNSNLKNLLRRHAGKFPLGVEYLVLECALASQGVDGCYSITTAARMNVSGYFTLGFHWHLCCREQNSRPANES